MDATISKVSEKPPPPENALRLADCLLQLHRLSFVSLSKSLEQGGVSFLQFCVLSWLSEKNPHPTMTEIARLMKHTTAATTGMIERLHALKYIQRQVPRDDRRSFRIKVTPKGFDLIARVRKERVDHIHVFMQFLEERDKDAWIEIHEKLFLKTGGDDFRFDLGPVMEEQSAA